MNNVLDRGGWNVRNDDDDELVTIDKLLEDGGEHVPSTWGARLKQWAVASLFVIIVLVVGGLAAIGAISLWLSFMLS